MQGKTEFLFAEAIACCRLDQAIQAAPDIPDLVLRKLKASTSPIPRRQVRFHHPIVPAERILIQKQPQVAEPQRSC